MPKAPTCSDLLWGNDLDSNDCGVPSSRLEATIRLCNEGAVGILGSIDTEMFDSSVPLFPKEVEAKTVGGGIDQVVQLGLEGGVLRRVELALEDRVLDALAPVLTSTCHLAKPFLASFIDGLDVVGDEYVHEMR